jgi:L-threonylcarbamoyladenylate synthase
MACEILAVDARRPDPAVIARAAAVLRAGGLVAFPTETVYGLGADALDAGAVARIFAAKGRPARNPLIVHVADTAAARALVSDWPAAADALARHFWPGPLTFVLPKRPDVPAIVTAGGPTVAVRVPAHPVALALLRAAGVPLAAPSANRSNYLSPTAAEHVKRSLGDRVDLILDGGPTTGGLESTVVDLTAQPPRLLRPGLVTPGAIEVVAGPLDRTTPAPDENGPRRSPGQLNKHYAPRTPLECITGDGRERVRSLVRDGQLVGWLTTDTDAAPSDPSVVRIQLPSDPAGYAAQLYAALHVLDENGLDVIVVDLPPATEAWMAVHDRLRRAAFSPTAPLAERGPE